MDDPLDSLNYHQMCFDGHTAYMGTAGTHSPSGSGQCAPEYHDLSAEAGADCSAMIMTAGPCGAAAVDPVPSANEPVTHTIQWTAGFGDEAARAITANVGDTLRFVWEGNHNVYKMPNKAAFDSCDFTSGANRVDGGVSPLDFPFTDALLRTAYFACSIADHCVEGQKLAVTPSPCDSLAACNGENPGTVGVSAACYQAVGGIIQAGQAPASWTACNDAQQATVSTACQEAIGSFRAGCEDPGGR
jgi:plastocyanin